METFIKQLLTGANEGRERRFLNEEERVEVILSHLMIFKTWRISTRSLSNWTIILVYLLGDAGWLWKTAITTMITHDHSMGIFGYKGKRAV